MFKFLFLFLSFINLSFSQPGGDSLDDSLDLGESSGFFSGLMGKYVDDMSKVNAFSSYSVDEMREIIRSKSKGKFMGKVFYNFPKLEDFASHWLVDETALPKFVSIFKKKEKLKGYGITSLLVVVIGYLLSSYLLRKHTLSVKRLIKKMFHSFLIFSTCLIFFYFAFTPEVTPSLKIVQKVFF